MEKAKRWFYPNGFGTRATITFMIVLTYCLAEAYTVYRTASISESLDRALFVVLTFYFVDKVTRPKEGNNDQAGG